jgi:Holliday junction resolvase RusA-like endonuclease
MAKIDLEKCVKSLLDYSSDPVRDIRLLFVGEYNKVHSENLDPSNLTENEELEIQKWLMKDSDVHFLSSCLKRILTRSIFFNEADKVGHIQRTPIDCPVCGSFNQNRFFSIRIPLKSHQYITSELKAYYQREIQSHPFVKDGTSITSGGVCLRLICVLNGSADKDVDNMAKLIIDGLKGYVFSDDKQVHHLQVIKYFSSSYEEHIQIAVAPSKVNDHSNILFEAINSDWVGNYRIDLPKR